jgi:hypothetical protein
LRSYGADGGCTCWVIYQGVCCLLWEHVYMTGFYTDIGWAVDAGIDTLTANIIASCNLRSDWTGQN